MPSTLSKPSLCAAILALCLPLVSTSAHARAGVQSAYTQPHEIDRVVADFTGAAIGEIGGAAAPADRRLRLIRCDAPLTASWHGTGKRTVAVECPSLGGWRIFIATRAAPAANATQPAKPVVKRGDPMTVVVRGRGFSVQQSGEAMDNGAIGDWIAVRVGGRNTRNSEPVRAKIERPGLAVIPAN